VRYAESIPDHCPPAGASEPEQLEVYRLLGSDSPSEIDFQSHAVRWPESFGDRRDCRAWSLSVFVGRIGINRLLGLRAHMHKKVGRLILGPNSGRIERSGKDPEHRSWWRYATFKPIPLCKVVE
jgi:hypothetical protein